MPKDVAVVFGTFQRRVRLERCIKSIRQAVGGFLAYEIIVVDGGSRDGSVEWLAQQPDVVLIRQQLPLTGAVKAFNLGFARAVDDGCPWVVQFNDDLTFGTDRAIERAVALMQADDEIGAVAFASDRYSPGSPSCSWMRYHDKCYCNQGVFRREAGMAAARLIGDPTGRTWWNPAFLTYASDTILGLAIWRLGWRIHEANDLPIKDTFSTDGGYDDPLRKRNFKLYQNVSEFMLVWGDPVSAEYHRADAEQFGGVLR